MVHVPRQEPPALQKHALAHEGQDALHPGRDDDIPIEMEQGVDLDGIPPRLLPLGRPWAEKRFSIQSVPVGSVSGTEMEASTKSAWPSG